MDSFLWESYNVTYLGSFGVEYISKEIKNTIDNKNITTNTYRIQAYDSIMWAYFVYWIIKDYNKRLANFTN